MDKATIRKELQSKMDSWIRVLDQELKGLGTNRASVNLLDPLLVEAYGDKVPLSQVASLSTSGCTDYYCTGVG